MAAKKRTSKKPRQAEAFRPDITVDQALQRVVRHGGEPNPDRVLDNAFANGLPKGLPLWEGENLVLPRFFANSLTVKAKLDDATGRYHAEIEATWNLNRPTSSYQWRTSEKAVARFLARRLKHAGGAPRKYSREEILIAAAVYVYEHAKRRANPPTMAELKDAVAAILPDGKIPGDTQLDAILEPLCEQLNIGLNAEMLSLLKLIPETR
jgi:hypothetical protein